MKHRNSNIDTPTLPPASVVRLRPLPEESRDDRLAVLEVLGRPGRECLYEIGRACHLDQGALFDAVRELEMVALARLQERPDNNQSRRLVVITESGRAHLAESRAITAAYPCGTRNLLDDFAHEYVLDTDQLAMLHALAAVPRASTPTLVLVAKLNHARSTDALGFLEENQLVAPAQPYPGSRAGRWLSITPTDRDELRRHRRGGP